MRGVEGAGRGDAAGGSVDAAPESLTYRLRVRAIIGRLGGGSQDTIDSGRFGALLYRVGPNASRKADSRAACLL